jgi:hypothetical protein
MPPLVAPLLLLLGFDSGTVWILIPLTALAIPIVAILTQPYLARLKYAERERLRQMYERIVMEKLDVVKTALSMGYKQSDLADLDARLEQIIGAEAMQRVLDGKQASLPSQATGALLPANDNLASAAGPGRTREREGG